MTLVSCTPIVYSKLKSRRRLCVMLQSRLSLTFYLHDAVYLYLRTVNQSLAEGNSSYQDGRLIRNMTVGQRFAGRFGLQFIYLAPPPANIPVCTTRRLSVCSRCRSALGLVYLRSLEGGTVRQCIDYPVTLPTALHPNPFGKKIKLLLSCDQCNELFLDICHRHYFMLNQTVHIRWIY